MLYDNINKFEKVKRMFSLKWWVILFYTVYILILHIYFSIYLKIKTGEGLGVKREMPPLFIWIFLLGIIGTWIIILIPIIYLFYPDIVDITYQISIIQNLPFEILGVILIILGAILTTIAMFQLGISARIYIPKQKTKLITSGVYQFCRNPAHIGMYLSFFGLFFLLPSHFYLIGLCLFLMYQHFRIVQEEKFLEKTFGDEYKNYMHKVGRYVPKIRKNPKENDSNFSI